MNSIRCGKCSLVNFSSSGVCKRCGEPLGPAIGHEPAAQSESFGTHSLQGGYETASEPYENQNHYRSNYGSSQAYPVRGKGKGVGITLLALVCLVGLIGVPWYLKSHGPSELANLSWREYNPDGSFSILMPGEPLKNNTNLAGPTGNINVTMYHHETPGQTAFVMGIIEYSTPPSVPVEMLFDKAIESLATRSQMTILSRKNITLNGRPGMEAEVKPPASAKKDGDKGVMRIYWVSPRIYMIMVGGPDSTEAAAARAKFLDSFKLLKSR